MMTKKPYLPWEVWAVYKRTSGEWAKVCGKEYRCGSYATEVRAKVALRNWQYKHRWASYEIRYNPDKIQPKTGYNKSANKRQVDDSPAV
jgi:hypothetical protein